jgi:hypothetical protein
MSNGSNTIVTCNDGVLKALIKIHSNFFFDLGADTSSEFVR